MAEQLLDANGLEVLLEPECWTRLREAVVGRLAFVQHGEPHVRPVNFLVDDGAVHLVTRPGAKLDTALARPGGPVAFEVDEVDPVSRTGWSVIVRGHLNPVMDEVEQARLDRLGAPAWLDMYRQRRWLRLDPVVVTGRHLHGVG